MRRQFELDLSRVVSLLALWTVFHALIRVFLIPTLGVDHVEQAVASQGWLLSYSPAQPPLYSWMQQAANQLFGATTLAFIVPKYVMVLGLLLSFYGFARATGLNDLHAALAVFSLALLYQVGWKIHFGMTHTLLMSLAIALTMFALARVLARGQRSDYLLLGVGVGMGIMGKYGFALFLLALILTLLPQRRQFSASGLMWSLAVTLVICSPLVWFAISHFAELATVYRGTMMTAAPEVLAQPAPGSAQLIAARASGLRSLFVASLGFLSPLWLVLLLCYPRMLPGLGPAASLMETNQSAARWRGFFARFFAVMALLLVLMVLVGGAARFKERWMHPFLLLAPIALMHRVQRVYPAQTLTNAPRHRAMLVTVGAFVVIAFGYRIAEVEVGPPLCGRCRHLVPHDVLAGALAPALGPDGQVGSVLASNEHIAGNLRIRFPHIAVFVPRYTAWSPEAFGMTLGTSCVVVWDGDSAVMPEALRSDLLTRFDTAPTPSARVETVTVPMREWRQRYPGWAPDSPAEVAFIWHYTELPGCGVVR